jgi:hypothetical protein
MTDTVFFRNLFLGKPGTPPIHGFSHGVAYISAGQWWYSGVNFVIASSYPVPINQQDVSSLKAWILANFGDSAPQESDYKPGTAYNRIFRPLNTGGSLQKAVDDRALTQSFVALKILLTKMEDIFETVEPGPSNLKTYGHKIRELLLLAAMDVEASWAAVLKANGYAGTRFTTNDYVKLLEPMGLDRFSLTLRSYPEFPGFTPFKGWLAQTPTKSLDWYDAYNQTKHNREECLGEGTLQRAVHTVGAAVVMLYAQFGYGIHIGQDKSDWLRNVFTVEIDYSMYPSACYIRGEKAAINEWEWKLIDFPFPPA